MGTEVKIVEVGPRDGLQNERKVLPVERKLELVERLVAVGLKEIEVGSFVSSKAVPQMADSVELLSRVPRSTGVQYRALIPNIRGMEAALAVNVDEVAVFASASETFSQRNINCTIDESFARFAPVLEAARQANVPVRGYLSCAFGCPYEGEISTGAVVSNTNRLLEIGCYEVAISDTIGVAGPGNVRKLSYELDLHIKSDAIGLHLHDTRGQALANVLAGLDAGVRTFDSSLGGLGGCPFAPGAAGNLATEELVYLLESLGVKTGVELQGLVDASFAVCQELGRPVVSRVAQAFKASGSLGKGGGGSEPRNALKSQAMESIGVLS